MRPSNQRITNLLLATQGVGAVFAGIFLAAYLGGLPTTTVLDDEPAFRIPLIIFGAALLVLILATVVLAAFSKNNKPHS